MMNFEFKTVRRYLKPAVLAIVVLISIKPAIFTWHLIRAGSCYRIYKQAAADHMYACLLIQPSVYKTFKRYNPAEADNLVIKSVIYNKNLQRLEDSHLEPADISRIKTAFKDNFYLQYLFNRFPHGSSPENLDDVSLELLADPSVNALTISIFKKIGRSFSRDFLKNVTDFCRWKGNHSLAAYLAAAHNIEETGFDTPASAPLTRQESLDRLKKILHKKYKPEGLSIGNNLLKSPGFDNAKKVEKHWVFSHMAGFKPFANASFTMGVESIPQEAKNRVLRLMGFFVAKRSTQGQTPPRAGPWYKKNIPTESGHYLFSFDYATKTGKEIPSFFLGKGIGERRIPPTDGKWKKVIFILNNTRGNHKLLRPLVRMWGTGSLRIDNVYLAPITDRDFAVPGSHTLLLKKLSREEQEDKR